MKTTQLNEIRHENDIYKKELIRLRQLLEYEIRNRGMVSSTISSNQQLQYK